VRLDRMAAPAATFKNDFEDGLMHVVGSFFGDPWCENEDLDLDDEVTNPVEVAANIDRINWCPLCLASAKEEGLIVE
jgi:hypothetical protein